jgi:hypothetical protein
MVTVVCIATAGAVLLGARQMRMQAAHELTLARLRVVQHDNELYRVRSKIAARITPEQVKQMAAEVSPLKSIASDVEPARLQAAAADGQVTR